MDAQLQIRQNVLEAQDFMHELMDWTHSMKQKAGSNTGKQHTDQGVPAVRGKAEGSVKNAPHDLQRPAMQANRPSAAKTAPPAAHTYTHYSKWDKFNADVASDDDDHPAGAKQQRQVAPTCKPQQPALPHPVQQPSSAVSGGSKQAAAGPTPKAVRPAAASATALKDQGNKLFQAGYFEDAVKCYTQSIDLQPTAVAYANRAMAHLKLGNCAYAELDCDAALQLDNTYIKALHRRGTARRQLGKLLEAADDFEQALRLDPGNATVQGDRDATLNQYLQQQKIQLSTVWSSIPVVQWQQAQPQPEQPQQQSQPAVAQPNVLQPARASSAAVAAQQPPTAGTSNPPGSTERLSSAVIGSRSNTSVGLAAQNRDSRSPAASLTPPCSPSPQESSTAAAAAAAAAQLAARRAANLKAPRTSNEFEAAWRSFKGDQQLQAKYLALVPAQQLPSIFKTSLTAPMLRAVLHTTLAAVAATGSSEAVSSSEAASAHLDTASSARDGLAATHAVALVEHMVSVPRFDMTVMCLTGRDKAVLQQLWDAAAAMCDAQLAERLAAVRPKYRL